MAAYRVAAWAAHRLGPVAGTRVAQSLAGRKDALRRWQGWMAAGPAGDVLWIHGASVGEALTAEPLARRLKTARPGARAILTCTSPSVPLAQLHTAFDHANYLPLDEPGPIRSLLALLRPRMLVFSRGDLWPELAAAAHQQGVPLALVGAGVRPGSGRLRWPVRAIFSGLYRSLSYVGAVTSQDAARLLRLGVRETTLEITGDPRHDQVLERIPALPPLRPVSEWAAGHNVLIAGSTDHRDEATLIEACAALRAGGWPAPLVLCPHQPNAVRCAKVAALAARAGIPASVWRGGPVDRGAACLIVERFGVLSDLYCLGGLAYVGGGFGEAGVHAVIEPAAYALPVITGPRGHSADLLELLAAGGAVALPGSRPGEALARIWLAWSQDGAARASAGLAARRTVKAGAASHTVKRLLGLLLPDDAALEGHRARHDQPGGKTRDEEIHEPAPSPDPEVGHRLRPSHLAGQDPLERRT